MRLARSAFLGIVAFLFAAVVFLSGCGPKRTLPGDWKFYTPYNAEAGTISFTDTTFNANFKTLDGSIQVSGPYTTEGSTIHLEFQAIKPSGSGPFTQSDSDDFRGARSFDLLVHWRDANVVELRSTAKGPGEPNELNFLLARNDADPSLDPGGTQVAIHSQLKATHRAEAGASHLGGIVTSRGGGNSSQVSQNPQPDSPAPAAATPSPAQPTPSTDQTPAPDPVDNTPSPPDNQSGGTNQMPDPSIPPPDTSGGTTTG